MLGSARGTGQCRKQHRPAVPAATSALRQENCIDNVNDAILLVDVCDRHEGLAALGVDNFEPAAVLTHGKFLAFDRLVHGLAAALFNGSDKLRGGDFSRNDVISQNRSESRLVFWHQQLFNRAFWKLIKGFVDWREDGERPVAFQGLNKASGLDGSNKRRVVSN
jgi:hypothetical protein